MSAVAPARAAAFQILKTVERGQAHSDDLLRSRSAANLTTADSHLATALVLGVLRWQLVLDERIRPLLKRPNARLDTEVRIALRLGAFQLLFLDRIPARAVIDESVELTKQAGHRFASGMVNAVLRKLAASLTAIEAVDAPAAYPAWMVERWTSFYGETATQAICAFGQSQSEHTLHVADRTTEQELGSAGIELAPGAFLAYARRIISGDVSTAPAFHDGRARWQDEGSQLVAEIAGKAESILDCCAAPGGKTLILAERNPHARIVACESSELRLTQLRKRLEPLGDRIECRLADATTLTDESAYDLVLVDAPCSGTGTLGRNPEIRYRLGLEDLPRQAERQRAILAAAIRATHPGGRVVYSTCSIEPEENDEAIASALAEQPAARIVPLKQRLDQMAREGIVTEAGTDQLRKCVTDEGYLRLLPGALGTDGFFIAVIEKTVL